MVAKMNFVPDQDVDVEWWKSVARMNSVRVRNTGERRATTTYVCRAVGLKRDAAGGWVDSTRVVERGVVPEQYTGCGPRCDAV